MIEFALSTFVKLEGIYVMFYQPTFLATFLSIVEEQI